MKIPLFLAVMLSSTVLTGCKPCTKLEERLCNDLGTEDCKVWREAGNPGFPSDGNERVSLPKYVLLEAGVIEYGAQACTGLNDQYDTYLPAIRSAVAATKASAQ